MNFLSNWEESTALCKHHLIRKHSDDKLESCISVARFLNTLETFVLVRFRRWAVGTRYLLFDKLSRSAPFARSHVSAVSPLLDGFYIRVMATPMVGVGTYLWNGSSNEWTEFDFIVYRTTLVIPTLMGVCARCLTANNANRRGHGLGSWDIVYVHDALACVGYMLLLRWYTHT